MIEFPLPSPHIAPIESSTVSAIYVFSEHLSSTCASITASPFSARFKASTESRFGGSSASGSVLSLPSVSSVSSVSSLYRALA